MEFDERGDYLNFEQHRHAYERVGKLAGEKLPLTLVIFVHGWRHNGQSGNVLDFNQFLSQLAAGYDDAGEPRRVHGIYLAWRGGVLRPTVKRDETFRKVKELYGGEIVDTRLAARWINLNRILESFSYFDRKSVPEHKFGGTSFSRTLFTLAFTAKGKAPASEVFLIGHSFGGLLLERTFQNAAISQLTESWRMGQERHSDNVNPLPFDSVVLVNSAAPSIYAKQFQSYLAAHRQAMIRAGVVGANAPIFFSLTSEADWATGNVHPIANRLAGLLPTLRRRYKGNEFILEDAPGNRDVVIPQAYYYRHTPGHNPLLVNRFIEAGSQRRRRATAPAAAATCGRICSSGSGDPLQFTTTGAPGQPDRDWMINFPPQTEHWRRFSIYDGRRPVAWTIRNQQYVYKDTAYWIVRCSKEIIAGHNDIWSQAAMETYAALHQAALVMRKQPLPAPPRRVRSRSYVVSGFFSRTSE